MRYVIPPFLILLLVVGVLGACTRTPDEQQVRDAIGAAASATEQGDARALGKILSEDFDGNEGELDRQRLVNMLRVQHLRGAKPGVLLGPVSIEKRGERLVADFTVTLSGGGRVLPDRLGVYKVQTAWKQEGSNWRCYSANWTRKL